MGWVSRATVGIGVTLPLACSGVTDELARAKVAQTEVRVAAAGQALEVHHLRTLEVPNTLTELGVEDQDAWGNPLVILRPGPNGAPFDVVSWGANGVPGGIGMNTDLRYSLR